MAPERYKGLSLVWLNRHLRPEPGFSPAKNAPYGIYRLAESGYIRWPWEYKIVITFMTGSEKKKG